MSHRPLIFSSSFVRRAYGLARLVNPIPGLYANERHPAIRLLTDAFNIAHVKNARCFVAQAALCDVWSVSADRRYTLIQSPTQPTIALAQHELPSWPHAWALVSDDDGRTAGSIALHFFVSQTHRLWNRDGVRVATNVCGNAFTLRHAASDDYAALGVEALLTASRTALTHVPPSRRVAEAS